MSNSSRQPAIPPLSIRLAESVVFLRGSSDAIHPRRRHTHPDAPPAMLRGLLTLHLSKPTRISSIEIVFEGKSAIQWPEDIPEEHTFLSTRTVFFDAKSCPSSNRSASVGPASRGYDDPFSSYNDSRQRSPLPRSSFDYYLHPSAHSAHPSPPERRNSSGESLWQLDPVHENMSQSLYPAQFATPPVSPPYTPSPAISELPVTSRPQTPIDINVESSHYRARSIRNEENPGQMLEEFRNALRMEMESNIRPNVSGSPCHSVPPASESRTEYWTSSPIDLTGTPPRSESAPGSRSTSREADHRHFQPSSISVQRRSSQYRRNTSPSPSPSPSTPPATVRSLHQVATHVSPELELESSQTRARRSISRWSLTNMSSVLKDRLRNTSKEPDLQRGRTSDRRNISDNHVDVIVTQDEGERKHREKERRSALGKLTAAVGLDEPSHVEDWKEFRRGTYTYPVSFAIPSTSPPTVRCDFGAIIYRLKAIVHRPGALTSKLVATREVTLVASPTEDDTEETHSIVVERQWDNQLRYIIAVNGRNFIIGSQMHFNLTMVPMEKCKVYRLTVSLEEKTEYNFFQRHVTREQPIKRFELLSIKHSEKNPPPILPLPPASASLLMPYLDTSYLSSTEDEALSSLMGPGPWTLTHELQLPAECGKIHFTYRHKGSRISVSHTLKIVFRVERGDDKYLDPKTGKRRLFDIVVQTPIHVLSCHCNPEWTSLPRYSLFECSASDYPANVLGRRCACSGGTGAPLATFLHHQTSPVVSPSNSRPTTAERRPNGHTPVFGGITDVSLTSVQTAAHLAESSHQFARLISGQESVLGDTPPRYQEVI